MKISEDYSMPIFSIPIRTKEFSSSYKSLYDIIQNEVGFEISVKSIFFGPSEINEGTIGDIIQQVKNSSQKISVICQLTENSVQTINNRISIVNQIIEFESNFTFQLKNQVSSSKKKSDLHETFLDGLRNSFYGYGSQVGWIFLNSFGINNDNYENDSTIIRDLRDVIPVEINDLFISLLNLTPLCHPDNFFLEQSLKILSKINSLNKSRNNNSDSIQNLFFEEEEENNSNGQDDESQDNFLVQNIDDYSMSTDEFVSTVEHILGQKDDIKISKNYDDENRRKPRKRSLNINQDENESELNSIYSTENSKSKEADYSRFFLFGRNKNSLSDKDSQILPEKTLLFSLATPRKKPSFVFNSEPKSNTSKKQNDDDSFSLHMSELESAKKTKTPIKRSIKLDSSKKYAYTPEERRCKAKQIAKFIKSSKEQKQYGDFSLFSPNNSPSSNTSNQYPKIENAQPVYSKQNDHSLFDEKDVKKHPSTKNIKLDTSDDEYSLLDQSNQLTEIIDFYIDDSNSENKKNYRKNYRFVFSSDNYADSTEYQDPKKKNIKSK